LLPKLSEHLEKLQQMQTVPTTQAPALTKAKAE